MPRSLEATIFVQGSFNDIHIYGTGRSEEASIGFSKRSCECAPISYSDLQ
jgi:hypothetical protein